MREVWRMFCACIVAIAIVGCAEKDGEDIIPQLSVEGRDDSTAYTSTIVFNAEGGQAHLAISSNMAWVVGCDAEWVTVSNSEGTGNANITLEVAPTSQSRSAVVVIYLKQAQQKRVSFDVVQHASLKPEPKPDEKPNDQPEDNPSDDTDEEENPDENKDSEQNPNEGENDDSEQNPNEGENDDSNEGSDNGTNEGSNDNSENTPEEQPNDQPEQEQPNEQPKQEEPDDQPEQDATALYSEITTLSQLQAGRYYIGGYQNEVLHLATVGTTVGHCNTTPYQYNSDGSLSPLGAEKAIEVELIAASEPNTYYIYFADTGYLVATAATAGKLEFRTGKERAWRFQQSSEGFDVQQAGEINARLIISARATSSLLRSIDGEEDDGNPIVLFRKK